MGPWPTQGDEKRLGPAITLYATVALAFVILSVTFRSFRVFCVANRMLFTSHKAVILRVCDFIGFAKKSTLKTKRLGASKGAKNQKSHSL